MKLALVKLSKHYLNNNAGEVIGVSPDKVEHLKKVGAAEFIGDFDTETQVWNGSAIVDAEPEMKNGKPTGNLVAKKEEAKPKAPPKDPNK